VRRGSALQDLGIIENGSVLIRDGVIAAVGTTHRIENLKEARDAVDLPVYGRLIMPGFADAGLSLSLDTNRDSRPATPQRKLMTRLGQHALALMRSCFEHGTVTAELKAEAPGSDLRSVIQVLRQLSKIESHQLRIVRTWRIHPPPHPDAIFSISYRDALASLAPRKLVQSVELAPGSEDTGTANLLAAAQELRFGIKLVWSGGSTDALANLLARFNPRTVRCSSHLSPVESSLLAKTDSIVVFAPANEPLEEPVGTAAKQAMEAGAAIALATECDYQQPASSSMQMALSLAVLRLHMTPEAAICAATINAAHAVGCGDITGSLEAGKQADILVLNVSEYHQLYRQFGINHVDMAIRRGAVVINRIRSKASGV
jgi:imidazolonepropionase